MAKRLRERPTDEELVKLMEVDGEFCVPFEAGQRRHILDWGPFEVERSAWYVTRKLLLFLPAMFLFILAVQLMKEGAAAVGPQIQGQFPFANGVSTLGAGWLGAYFVLSGSPVAATAVSLFGAGTIDELQTLTMISGSRLGASFIVLITGFLYAVRGAGKREESIGIGIQAMSTTALVYLPGTAIAYLLLRGGTLSGIDWHASGGLDAVLGFLWGPLVDLATENLPGWALFLVGLGVILVAFNLLDRVLPAVSSDSTASKRAAWLRNPWTMFLLGCLVATLTLSVSVALTILVPLASRGLVKREEALPYIMGANVMTLADTVVVAMLQPTAEAAQIVLAQAIGVAVVSIAILLLAYEPVKRTVIRLDDVLVSSNRRLAGFVAVLFLLPVTFLLTGLFFTNGGA
jgi:Na+/phosphate symporter